MKKNDYTYIALLDPATDALVKTIQEKLIAKIGYSDYMGQWPPHATLSFGNTLTTEDLIQVEEELKVILNGQVPVAFHIAGLVTHEKTVEGESYCAVRLKISPSSEIDELSQKIISVAQKYKIPFDVFTNDHYHIGLGRYQSSQLVDIDLNELLPAADEVSGFFDTIAVYYGMINDPKPEKAYEVARIKIYDQSKKHH
jgi:2'-5' RNA ligase